MAFRSANSAGANTASSVVVTKPSGVVSGDILLAAVHIDEPGVTITWPSGFTQLEGQTSTTDGATLAVAWKLAGGSEPASYTLSVSFSDHLSGIVAAWSGRDTSTPIDDSSIDTEDAIGGTPWDVITATATATAGGDVAVFAAIDSQSAGTVTWTAPSGYTSQTDTNSPNGWAPLALFTKDNVSAGALGVLTASGAGTGTQAGTQAIVVTIKQGSAAATLEQSRFRWRNDDGSESAATWAAAENTDISIGKNTPKRLRVQIQSTNDKPSASYKLQYRKVGDPGWQDVN